MKRLALFALLLLPAGCASLPSLDQLPAPDRFAVGILLDPREPTPGQDRVPLILLQVSWDLGKLAPKKAAPEAEDKK